ncbi:hypothetical protein BDZ89DRAFT_994644 [Hymenopellis radicata]|nr:hypothetical protein BDZ89DRAFT_994644 [Hymenopellis radicata]
MASTTFDKAWRTYLTCCATVGVGWREEKLLYKPRVDVYNAALDFLDNEKLPASERIRFYVNDPERLMHGVYAKGLSVDLGQVSTCLLREGKSAIKKATLGAVMLLGAEEMKAQPGCLASVKEFKYKALSKNGRDPAKDVLNDDSDDPFVSDGEPGPDSDEDLPATSQQISGRKRKIGPGSYASANKVIRTATRSLGECKELVSTDEVAGERQMTGKLENAQVQCASYAMEALSLTPLRSHYILSLVDRTKLQLMYFDSSVILVSPPVDMKKKEGKEVFLSMIVGLRRMSLQDRGVRNIIRDNAKFYTDLSFFKAQLSKPDGALHWRNMLTGMILDTKNGPYKIEDILFRQAGIVGRLTYVVRARKLDPQNLAVEGPSVVIKISCPSMSRTPEVALLKQAREAAEKEGGEDHWVLKHLPKVLHSEDIVLVKGSTQHRVAEFLLAVDRFTGAKYPYEYRVLRIVVLEELFPVSTLGDPSQYAQVFFDILNCHKWLYDSPRILHRDISMSNLMYRFDDDHNVCGVLNDMDLSSDLNDREDLKATSLRRTGTPPFMAIDLLRKNSIQPEHIYRHDLESLFYVMLILFTRYELTAAEPTSSQIQDRAERLAKRSHAPLSEWFDSALSWEALSKEKLAFINSAEASDSPLHTNNIISSSFQGFKPWISRLKEALQDGIHARIVALRKEETAKNNRKAPPSFDYATFGGEFQYSTFFDVMKNFGDKALRAPPQSLDIDATMEL